MSLVRRIPEGGFYPNRWYGVAYDEWQDDGAVQVVCLPMPLNILARFWVGFWRRIQHGWPMRFWGAQYVCRSCQARSLRDDWKRIASGDAGKELKETMEEMHRKIGARLARMESISNHLDTNFGTTKSVWP